MTDLKPPNVMLHYEAFPSSLRITLTDEQLEQLAELIAKKLKQKP